MPRVNSSNLLRQPGQSRAGRSFVGSRSAGYEPLPRRSAEKMKVLVRMPVGVLGWTNEELEEHATIGRWPSRTIEVTNPPLGFGLNWDGTVLHQSSSMRIKKMMTNS